MRHSAFVTPLFRLGSVPSQTTRHTSTVSPSRPFHLSTSFTGLNLSQTLSLHNARTVTTATTMTSSASSVTTDPGSNTLSIADPDAFLRSKGYKPGDIVLLFDGVCVLCNAGVDFVLEHDKSKQIKFAALQSDVGQSLLDKFNAPKDLSTVVLIQNNRAFVKSEAVLRVGKLLNWYFAAPAQLASMALPKLLRDYFYSNVVAKNRYDWFGEKEECRLIDNENRSRFLY